MWGCDTARCTRQMYWPDVQVGRCTGASGLWIMDALGYACGVLLGCTVGVYGWGVRLGCNVGMYGWGALSGRGVLVDGFTVGMHWWDALGLRGDVFWCGYYNVRCILSVASAFCQAPSTLEGVGLSDHAMSCPDRRQQRQMVADTRKHHSVNVDEARLAGEFLPFARTLALIRQHASNAKRTGELVSKLTESRMRRLAQRPKTQCLPGQTNHK